MPIGRYLVGLSIAANQLANALSGGSPIETVSSRAGLAREHGSHVGGAVCAVLSTIDRHHERPNEDHCQKAIRHLNERTRAALAARKG